MASPTRVSDGLKCTWKLAGQRTSIDPRTPTALPPLFAFGADQGLAVGFRYELDRPARGASGRGTWCAEGIGCSSRGSCGGNLGCGGD